MIGKTTMFVKVDNQEPAMQDIQSVDLKGESSGSDELHTRCPSIVTAAQRRKDA